MKSNKIEIRIPRENVNDDSIKIAKWYVKNGDFVEQDQLIVCFESSKASMDFEATADGIVEIIVSEGHFASVGEIVGYITDENNNKKRTSNKTRIIKEHKDSMDNSTSTTDSQKFSIKALMLMKTMNIPKSVFEKYNMVREQDVITYNETHILKTTDDSNIIPTQMETKVRAITTHKKKSKKQGLFGDARISANERGKSLPWLVFNYLWRNWFLGNLVKVAPRGLIIPLHRLRGVKIGKDVYIDPTAIIETAYPEMITIGNDVRIAANSIIMCHIKAPHFHRNNGLMPLEIKPVTLHDHSFIGVNAVLLPGVKVGKASVVSSGAIVFADVPPFTMVSGNPAKVVKQFPKS